MCAYTIHKKRHLEILRILAAQASPVWLVDIVHAFCERPPNKLRVLELFNSCKFNSDWRLENGYRAKPFSLFVPITYELVLSFSKYPGSSGSYPRYPNVPRR